MTKNTAGGNDPHWIEHANIKPGALHRNLGIPEGQPIPSKTLEAAAARGGEVGKEADLAEEFRRIGRGGKGR